MSYDILLGCFSSRLCFASAGNCSASTGGPDATTLRNDLSDLFPPAFVNSQMVRAVSHGFLVPVRSLRMPSLYEKGHHFCAHAQW